jgi:hypothetical protein
MRSINAVSLAIGHYRDSFESAKKAASVLAGGPADFYLGDRVALTAGQFVADAVWLWSLGCTSERAFFGK